MFPRQKLKKLSLMNGFNGMKSVTEAILAYVGAAKEDEEEDRSDTESVTTAQESKSVCEILRCIRADCKHKQKPLASNTI